MNRKKSGYAFILLVIFVDIIGTGAFYGYASYLFNKEVISNAQVAVVLFASMDDNFNLSSETKRRMIHALSLIDRRLVKDILCVGGARAHSSISGADVMKRWFIQHGVSSKRVFTGCCSRDTITNIESAINFLKRKKFKSACFVSSPVHLLRVRYFCRNKKGYYFFYDSYPPLSTIPRIKAWEIVAQVHHEWLAWLSYFILPTKIYRSYINVIRSQGSGAATKRFG